MNKYLFSLAVLYVSFGVELKAQAPTCSPTVPFYTVDLRGNPTGSWISPGHVRNSNCCGTVSPDRCTSFEIYVDSGAAMISFEIASGAIPPGSMFYQINCGPQIPVGQPICITGEGPHYLTFCKPGNNQNTYKVTSIAKPTFPPDDTTRIGCAHPIPILGMVESSVTWNSIFPGAPGAYNSFLNCLNGCDTALYTPDSLAPPMVEYLVCGLPTATTCGYIYVCDTVRIYNQQPLQGLAFPNPGYFCQGGPGVSLTASATGGSLPYAYTWRDQFLSQVCNTATCLLTTAGNYSIEIRDQLYDSTYCPAAFISATVVVTPPPVVDAGPDQTLCPTSPVVVLNGSVLYATGGTWTGGAGAFDPGATSLFTTYTPTPAEIASGSVTLTLTSTGAGGGCTDSSDQVTIFFPAPLNVSVGNVNVNCSGGTATLTSSVSGGIMPYTYQWSTGQTTSSITSGQGAYCLTVTDLLGCTSTDCGTISVPSPLNISISSTACSVNGGNDGTATTVVSGGTAPYTYLWSNSGTTATITGLSYGVYTVTATDANGCTIVSSVVVNEPRCNAFSATATAISVSCFGDNDGSATATTVNGTSPFSYLWNPSGQTTSSISNLTSGVYQCVITDANACFATVNISVTQPTQLINTMTHVNATTVGGTDGSATTNAGGGTPAYTYSWSTGATTSSIGTLSAGTYSVTITDAQNCSLADSVQINEPPCSNLIAGVAATNVSCNGGNNGTANAVVIMGVSPISYLWSTGATTSSISGLAAGNYSVLIVDGINCSTFVNFTITEPSPLSLALSPTDIRCENTNDGTIELTVSGGVTPYTYVWTNGLPTEDLVNLSGGSYTVTVTDANGCTATGSATIVNPPLLVVTTSVSPVTCNGGSDGSVDASVAGGIAPYAYTWSNGPTTQDISGLVSGEYLLTVTDANNCSTEAISSLIDEPDTVKITSAIAACPLPGSGLSQVTMAATGGNNGSYQFSVDGGATYLSPGVYSVLLPVDSTYTIVVRDTFGCAGSQSFTLAIAPEAEILATAFASCIPDGATSVPVTLSVTGGSGGPLQASFDNGATWLAYGVYTANLATGASYSIIVRDSAGCASVTENITISTDIVLSGTPSSFIGGYNISCQGLSDGAIDLSSVGGTGVYTYAWSNAATTQDVTSLTAGTYSVIVTDNATCSDTIAFTLTEPAALTGNVVSANDFNGYEISCAGGNNGGADLTISGGVTGYDYLWSNNATTEDISSLTAGTYSVAVTDTNGCQFTTSITLTAPAALTATSVQQDILCNSLATGSIDLSPAGGVTPYTFAWSNAATTEDISTLIAGTYSVTMTDLNGCTFTDSFTLTEPTAVVVTNTLSNYNGYNISCSGSATGNIDLDVSGGIAPYTYNWSNSSATEDISSIIAGTYSVLVIDANGCAQTQSFILTEPAALSDTIASANNFNGYDISCFGGANGAIDYTVNGGVSGYTYSWSNGSTTEDITAVIAGIYTVTATDLNGCTIADTLTLIEPAALGLASTVQDVLCYSFATGSIDVTISGGVPAYVFVWSNGATSEDVTGLTSGSYNLMLTDLNGCTYSSSFTVTEPTPVAVTNTVSDFNGYNISCSGLNDGTVDLTVNGGTPAYTFNWSDNSVNEDLTNVIAGTYSVTVTDGNSCTSTYTFTLSEPAALAGTIASVNDYNGYDVRCYGDSSGAIDLNISGGVPAYTYSWSNGATSEDLTTIGTGIYSVVATDLNGCTYTTSIGLSSPPVLSMTQGVTNIPCNGYYTGVIDITIGGGVLPYGYNWSNGQTTEDVDSLGAGNYSVIMTDANGCVITNSFSITELAPIVLTQTMTIPLCFGDLNGGIDLSSGGGTAPFTYNWSTGASTEDLSGIGSGTYTVTVNDVNNCFATDTFFIGEPGAIFSSVSSPVYTGGYNVSGYGTSDGSADLTVNGGTAPYTYAWNNGGTTEDLNNIPAGTYTVITTDANGCQSIDTITLYEPLDLAMPTGFSPNGDGFNDYFVVHGIEIFPENTLEVYNRWGNLVYDSKNYSNQWYGNNETGEALPDGTYFVILNINNDAIVLKGYVDIRR